jgi:Domain of unknown function (DUF4386)
MSPTKRQARRAGLLYLLAGLTAPFALLYVPRTLTVSGDAAATADRIRASESLLRLGIGAELLGTILSIFVVFALYRLFRGVSEIQASWMAALFLVSLPVSLLNLVNHLAALMVASGPDYLSAFDRRQLDALAYLFMRLHNQGIVIAQVFWGLWLFPFGILVIRSGFIPRFLGVLLFLAGSGYVAASGAVLLLPRYARVTSQASMILGFGELAIILWLLIWGAKGQPAREAIA